jgi:hypothetical protein
MAKDLIAPVTEARSLHNDDRLVKGYLTELDVAQGHEAMVNADTRQDETGTVFPYTQIDRAGLRPIPQARLRCIGYVDQKGVVWREIPSGFDYNGGAYYPLLIDPGERDGS